ncbi:MAG TPA: M56 family metallopeptidase [Pirellulales bacterium]|jgi:hypothetical protein|nr:M56 family metallopeptidase [Pirellulales bacterium]
MYEIATQFWPILWRTTLTLTVAALLCGLLLRPARPRSPLLHRVGWLATLLVGWSFLRLTVPVAWYDPPHFAPAEKRGGMLPASMIKQVPPAAPPAGETIFKPGPNSWPAVAVVFWGLGIVGWIGTWLTGYVRFLRRLPTEQPAEPDWDAQWRSLLVAAGVPRLIRLRVTADAGPLLCRRPSGYELMVPAGLWRDLEVDQRAAILRHELAHYLRGDLWKSLLARVLMLPHWFNPAAWWAVRRFEEAGEWACDQSVLDYAPPSTYAQTLLKLGEQVATAGSPGVAARGASLAVRIRRLLLSPTATESKGKQAAMIVAVCLTAALALLRVELVAKEPATQGLQAEETARLAEATAILEQLTHSHDSAIAGAAQHALDELRRSPSNRPASTANLYAEPAYPSLAPPVPHPAPDGPTTYHVAPGYPNQTARPATSGPPWIFKGPRGETFKTDGSHLWRLDSGRVQAAPGEAMPNVP